MPQEEKSAVEATREASFFLAAPEKRFLRRLAARLPRWILPDDMTILGGPTHHTGGGNAGRLRMRFAQIAWIRVRVP